MNKLEEFKKEYKALHSKLFYRVSEFITRPKENVDLLTNLCKKYKGSITDNEITSVMVDISGTFHSDLDNMNTKDLTIFMGMHLRNEEYEKAIPFRDEINRRNN